MTAPSLNPDVRPGRPAVIRQSWWKRGMVIVVVGMLGVAVVALSVMLFGMVRGEEFCPRTFERREFTFYQIPLLGLQVTPVFREDMTSTLEKTIATTARLPGTLTTDKRWDPIMVYRAGSKKWLGDAVILRRYIELRDASRSPVWLEWTRDQPALADILWPVVAQLAEHQHYFLVPDVMELASRTTRAEQMHKMLHQHLRDQYRQLADMYQARGDHEQSRQLAARADQHELLSSRPPADTGRNDQDAA